MSRTRRVVGLLTLVLLVGIVLDVTGFQPQLPRIGGGTSNQPQLQGVRALAAAMLLRVGSGAPPGGELAFLAVESNGNLVVSDSKRRTVMRFDPTGQLLTSWGPTFGSLQLTEPAGVAVSGGSYYVIDRGTPRIFKLDGSGQVQSIMDLQPLSTYGLNGLAVDAAGNLYAADTGRNRILMLSPSGQLLKQIGHGGTDPGAFTQPMMLTFAPDGTFFVADWENSRVDHWDASFESIDNWSLGFNPFGIAVDQSGRVYVPDTDHHRVETYSPQGAQLGEIGQPNNPLLDIAPKQVAVAPGGQLSVYALGGDGVERLDLENTAPPAPQGGPDQDLLSLALIAVLLALLGLAVLSRRQRRSLRATLDRPVGLDAKDGAQRQQQQSGADEELLIANQSERKQ
jgi:DNA-binding beta-propeller fold protein YncE